MKGRKKSLATITLMLNQLWFWNSVSSHLFWSARDLIQDPVQARQLLYLWSAFRAWTIIRKNILCMLSKILSRCHLQTWHVTWGRQITHLPGIFKRRQPDVHRCPAEGESVEAHRCVVDVLSLAEAPDLMIGSRTLKVSSRPRATDQGRWVRWLKNLLPVKLSS